MRAVDQVASTEKRCAELIAKQGPLVDEAAAEPDLWRAPFFTQGYIKLVELQKKITLLLVRIILNSSPQVMVCVSKV
jgi:hypothetical protein